MPVIGYAVNNGHLSFIYKLGQNDFLRTIVDAVHAAHPFHLVGGFERFGHIFLPCHIGNDVCHTLVAGLVDLRKMPVQRSACEQVCVENGAMFFQIAAAHTPVFADLIVASVRQGEIRDEVISLPTVSAAHLFKQGLYKATAPFCVGFQRLYEFCSFPITAFQFTTNEPQSYVLGG